MRNPLAHKTLPIALDVGADGVKLLQLQRANKTLAVTAAARRTFPDAAELPAERRRELTIGAVRDLLAGGGFRGRRVVTALHCDELGIKNVRLPSMAEAELPGAVAEEAAERLGYEAGQDELNYLRAGQVRTEAETREEVLLLTAKKDVVDQHLAMVEATGLRIEHIDAAPVALFRSFERFLRRRADENAVSVVIDIGLSGTRVVVGRGRRIVFIKPIDLGGVHLTKAVAKELKLSVQEAAELRARMRSDQEPAEPSGPRQGRATASWTLHDALRSQVAEVAREIQLCLRYCSVTFRGLRPHTVTLTGGEAYDGRFVELLREALNLECTVGAPLRGMDVSGVDLGSNRRGLLSEWALCAGLALRGVEVGRREDGTEHEQHRLSA